MAIDRVVAILNKLIEAIVSIICTAGFSRKSTFQSIRHLSFMRII